MIEAYLDFCAPEQRQTSAPGSPRVADELTILQVQPRSQAILALPIESYDLRYDMSKDT